MNTLLKNGIYSGLSFLQACTTIDLKAPAFPIPRGQVLTRATGGTVAKANATTDKTAECLVATESWDPTVRNSFYGETIELVETNVYDPTPFKMILVKGTPEFVEYTDADVNKKCGLNADGTLIDKANTTELVQIVKIDPVSYGDPTQSVYFRFI